jgi:hypothetical protein
MVLWGAVGGNGELVFSGYRVSAVEDERLLEMDGGNDS